MTEPEAQQASKHILGMEPENVARQMIDNYRATMGPDFHDEDCLKLMLEFNRWLVETNEALQRQVLDKLNTTLPAPMIVHAPAAPSQTTPLSGMALRAAADEADTWIEHGIKSGAIEWRTGLEVLARKLRQWAAPSQTRQSAEEAILAYAEATRWAMKMKQVVGEDSEYFVTLAQLEDIFKRASLQAPSPNREDGK